jgi:DNA polymerase-3 subunit alpha
MASPSFTHLHVHSHFSLLDGAITVPALINEAVRHDMGSLALTDHGNLFGAIEFYTTAKDNGINPIIGCEAYLVNGDATRKPPTGEKRPRYHITLLAKNRTGFENLSRLSSLSWTTGYNRKPCIDKSMLSEYSDGLIALSGCLSGEVARNIHANKLPEAIAAAEQYAEILGRDNVYLEVMSNGLEQQKIVRDGMPAVAAATGLPLVATNDIHYRCQGDSVAQDALICIGTGQRMHDPNRRFRIDTDELFFRSSDEMAALFDAESEAYRSTAEIASRCNIEIDLESMHLPHFEIPSGEPPAEYMRRLCEGGLRRLYGEITPAVRDRFEKEFGVIESMGFVSYFLIVWDLIAYARRQGIPVGPGRGSAAGSIVAYSLDITRLDPLKYNLLFERFLNADRISMPDIDIDFCRDRREEVIEYTRQKYGSDQVCQIVTFGTMAAKAAVRDAGRVLEIPLSEVDKIAKRIPDLPKTRLADAIAGDSELRELFQSTDQLRELERVSQSIEGLARNTSTHAAGVVITEKPLIEHVPLCVVQGALNTQFQMTDLEHIGLLKMDFLGLKNLTILQKVADAVKRSHGVEIDYEELGVDDAATYELLRTGETSGVFQLESAGMRELIVRLEPDCFEDIIALIALYRPGPLQSGMVDSFVKRKHGEEKIEYAHPLMVPILEDTYGAMIYQEQVMLLAQSLGGLSLNEADGLRKAMGKKKLEVMNRYQEKFLEGCTTNGIKSAAAEKIWSDMSQFAQYGFNKSHSAAYGLITYRTAYMKTHYPAEYMAALMSCDSGDSDKLAQYAEVVRRSGRAIEGPCVNRSMDDFVVQDDGCIRFGLNAIKGLGSRAVQAVLNARGEAGDEFSDLGELLDNLDCKAMNRAAFDALARAGALDSLGASRTALLSSSDRLLKDASRNQSDRAIGQASLFGGGAAASVAVRLDDVAPPGDREVYLMEKETLGFAVTVDPMKEYRALLCMVATHDMVELGEVNDRAEVILGGMVNALRTTISSKGRSAGKAMGLFKIQGLGGSCGALMFSKTYAKYREVLQDDYVGLFRGRVDMSREDPTLLVDEVLDINQPEVAQGRRLLVDVSGADPAEVMDRLVGLKDVMLRYPGPTETFLSVQTHEDTRRDERAIWRLPREGGGLGLCPGLVQDVEAVLGPDHLHLR